MPPRGRIPTLKDCAVPGCKGAVVCKGLCHAHYEAKRQQAKRDMAKQNQRVDGAA